MAGDMKERMLSGELYRPDKDGLPEDRMRAQTLCWEYSRLNPADWQRRQELLEMLFGYLGENAWVEQPFHCDYGYNIHVGKNFYANYNCTILDCAKVTIGDNVLFAPNVSLFTAGHPIDPDNRNTLYEFALPITIGDNVWIGGNAVVNPGITIGANTVVASGSVVTHDLPSGVVAAGNPCRVLREITEEDKKFYRKGIPFAI